MTETGERTILTARRPELRTVALSLVGAGVVCVLVDLAVWQSLSLLTLVGFLFWFAAAGIQVAPPVVLVRASPAGIAVGPHEAAPWPAVKSVVLTRREVLRPTGTESSVFVVLASTQITEFTPLAPVLQEDARVLLAYALPPALADLDVDQLRARLQTVHPSAVVVDHRG
ncbi:hypothetical protein EV186_105335 [Labedaea rhizosphaerae]|uniref:Uncharacterized protein n=1 Tax=Labedaea rhizosphaerae TaxID=598644 RepID=A0A4R6S6W4_LABRH|nr:hypothetical protein EV186_105335 [Labedaea rhizosphaerae]